MKTINGGKVDATIRIARRPGYTRGHHLLMIALLLLSVCTTGLEVHETALRLDLQSRCLKRPYLPECRGSVLKRAISNSHALDEMYDEYYWSKLFRNAPTLESRTWDLNTNEGLNLIDNNFMDTYNRRESAESSQENPENMVVRWLRLRQPKDSNPTRNARLGPVLRHWIQNQSNYKY